MMNKPLLPDPEPIITETPGAPTGRIKYLLLNTCSKHVQVESDIGFKLNTQTKYILLTCDEANMFNVHIQFVAIFNISSYLCSIGTMLTSWPICIYVHYFLTCLYWAFFFVTIELMIWHI